MSSQILKIIAALMLIGSLILITVAYQMGKSPQPPVTTSAQPSPPIEASHQIVKAANTILPGHAIDENDLATEVVTTPPSGAYKTKAEVLGKRTIVVVEKGMPLLPSHFATGSALAQTLKPNERAIAVKVDEFIGVGGFIQPGDFVDVIAFVRPDSLQHIEEAQAVIALHAIRVLAYGEEMPVATEKKTDKKPEEAIKGKTGKTTAILALDAEQTSRLSLLENAAILRLALRPSGATSDGEDEPYSVTIGEVIAPNKTDNNKPNRFQPAKSLGPMVEIYHGTQVEQIQYP